MSILIYGVMMLAGAPSEQAVAADARPDIYECRAWATLNVQSFKTDVPRWQAYNSATFDRLNATVGIAELSAQGQSAGSVFYVTHQDELREYRKLLKDKAADQAMAYRRQHFGRLDEFCRL